MTFLLSKDLGNTCSEAMNTRGTKQGKNVHAKPSSFPSNEQYRNRGFFFSHAHKMIILVLRISWFEHGCYRLISYIDLFFDGICRDLCFHSCWFFVVVVVVAFPFLPISHLKNLFLAHLKVARIVRDFWCSKILIHILSC